MSILLQMYPGDAWCLLVANVLVQVTVVIVLAWLLAMMANRLCRRNQYTLCVPPPRLL